MTKESKKYQIILADPPWHFKNYNDDTASRWVGGHYPILGVKDVCNLPIQSLIAENCALFLWVTAPCLEQGLQVIKAWGFTYKTKAFCWVKTNRNSSIFTGMGYWTRSNSEDCLLATRGNPHRLDAGISQVIETELIMSQREEHSKKPDITRERIVSLLGDLPRIELFARQKVEGWDCWGNEVESDIEL